MIRQLVVFDKTSRACFYSGHLDLERVAITNFSDARRWRNELLRLARDHRFASFHGSECSWRKFLSVSMLISSPGFASVSHSSAFGSLTIEDSVPVGGADLAGVHAGRERDAAAERTDVALACAAAWSAVAIALPLALAADRPASRHAKRIRCPPCAFRATRRRPSRWSPLSIEIERGRPAGKKLARARAELRPERHTRNNEFKLVPQIAPPLQLPATAPQIPGA